MSTMQISHNLLAREMKKINLGKIVVTYSGGGDDGGVDGWSCYRPDGSPVPALSSLYFHKIATLLEEALHSTLDPGWCVGSIVSYGTLAFLLNKDGGLLVDVSHETYEDEDEEDDE